MEVLATYLWGVTSEGFFIGFVFWAIVYVSMERSSLGVAIRAGLISEAVGNLPYLFGEEALGPIGLVMSLVATVIFVRQILRAGELNLGVAAYGVLTTYFILVAVISCSPQ